MGARPALVSRGWLVVVAAAATAPPLASILTGHTLVWRDTVKLFAPMRPLVVEALRDLRLPLWNPYEGLGVPLFAQLMHAVLHPVSLVAALAAPRSGADLLIVAHVALAAMGAAVLARTLGTSRAAAALAGLGYGLSGYVLGMSAVLTYLGAAATAPWTIAALCLAGRGKRWGAPAAAVAVAALHFAGDPQWTVVAVAGAAALVVAESGPRGLARASAAALLGTGLAAVQLLPAAAFLRETARAAGLSPAERAQWALSPWRLPELLAPGFLAGHPGETLAPPVFRWVDGSPQRSLGLPFLPSVFVGAALIVLSVAGALRGRRGHVLAGAVAVSLWLALGQHGGAEQALHALPVWGAFRYSEKLVGPLTLWLSLLAALGTDRLAVSIGRGWTRATAAGAITLGLLAVVFGTSSLLEGWPGIPTLVAATASGQLAVGLGHASAALVGLAAALAARRGRRVSAGGFGAICAAIVFLGSAAAAPFALHAGAPGIVALTPLAGIIRGDGPFRIAMPQPFGPYLAPPELDAADQAVAAQSRLAFASFNVPARIDHLTTYTGVPPRRLSALYEAMPLAAMRRYGLTHVVATPPRTVEQAAALRDAIVGGALVLEDQDWGYSVWAVPHRPWAFFADRIHPVAGEDEALRAVRATADVADPPVTIEASSLPAPPSGGRVLALERATELVQVIATSERAAVLVVNDAWWPGWRATIDGHPVPIWRADYAVRAVPWPAGEHVLRMVYDPPEVRLGIVTSALAALCVVGASIISARRRRSGSNAPATRDAT